ncbi:radical SAM protein [Arthrobacter sp. NicSoilB4]|uniref:Rv2578c family radical SAM protein n=1 Tax=Arthrobacter sp. NicSoilB4 TaxID=2830997 RepID=UPI001CC675DE|nr:Rv2578c family radical SAM protein [Arthrobacter sp. NicSoilB4]BCW66494.1 radical SAM protein [Arthrobacter sp. NicSoilB4]
MRWDAQALKPAPGDRVLNSGVLSSGEPRHGEPGETGGRSQSPAPDALLPLIGLVRSVTTPEFAGVTFHEVTAKSVLNKVVAGSRMPFEWTINPYRGCSHACVYCFARKSHTYLDFDAGLDFDSQVVVKINAAEVLRRELAKPSWGRQHVALGTNTDPYQRAEGRYQLMPGIIGALADSGTPLSILTKGTLLARDIPLLKHAAAQVPVGVGISLAMTDERLSEAVEPGTPGPRARLKLITRLRDAGLPCGVMAMPILPWLSDSDEALDSLFASLAAAGATGVTAGALYLKPGTREWFMQWIAREHPQLAGKYRRLYGTGSYASKEYRDWLSGRVRYFKARHGFSGSHGFSHRDLNGDPGNSDLGSSDPGSIDSGSIDPRDEEAQYPAGSIPGPAALAGARHGSPAAEAAQPTLF